MGQPQDNYSAQPHAVPYNDLPSDLPELSIVLPCLNEAETLEKCIHKALAGLRKTGVCGEIIVVDNGSEDGSKDIVRRNQAQLVLASPRGYGSALRTGIEAARGTYVLIADADDSYDLSAVD